MNSIIITYFIFVIFFLNLISLMSAEWIESAINFTVYASQVDTYALYSRLDQHPRWSPWLEEVIYDETTGLSHWTVASMGLKYKFSANNVERQPPVAIAWHTITGKLQTRGRVELEEIIDKKDENHQINTAEGSSEDHLLASQVSGHIDHPPTHPKCLMKLTFSYHLPLAATLVIKALGPIATSFVHNTILSDLKRFEKVLLEDIYRRRQQLKLDDLHGAQSKGDEVSKQAKAEKMGEGRPIHTSGSDAVSHEL